MQRENVLDNILIDSNLFPEYANIKTSNFLPCCRKLQTPAPYTFLLHQTDSCLLWDSSALYPCPPSEFDSVRYVSGIFTGQPYWWRPPMPSSRMAKISALVKWEQVYKYIPALCHKTVWE